MNTLIEFGIAFIAAFQSMGAWLEAPMKFFSFLGSENFFLFFLPLVYWSIDAALGIRVGFILFSGISLNQLFKLSLLSPRPFWVSPDIRAFASEIGFGMPSGHAEIAAGLWGMIAAYYRKAWVWVAAVLLVFFIGLSRLYLGVHFPHDVLAGWALGFLTLWVLIKLWEPVEARLKKLSFWSQVGLAFVASLVLLLIGTLILFITQDFVLPPEWIANATRDGSPAPDPITSAVETLISSVAAFFGLCTALAWMAPRGGFVASGPLWKRAFRYAVGLIGVLVFYAGLKAVFPYGDTLVPLTFRYIRYAVVGFWIAGGAPWVFAKLNLTEKS